MKQEAHKNAGADEKGSVGLHVKGMTRSLLIFAVLMLLVATPVRATHFRFGLVTATRLSETTTTVTYQLNVSLSWRLGTAPASVPFTISGGNTGSFSVTMTNVTDPTGSWTNGTGTYTVTLNKTSTLTKIEFTGFSKLTTISNNASTNWDVYTILNTNAPGSTPVSTLPAIINVQAGDPAATFMVPATDPDPGSTVTYGYPNLVSGPLAGETEPLGLSVNSSTGQVTFNTTATTPGQQYNALITVTDNYGNQIMLDFLINMVAPSTPPSFDYTVTPLNGTIFNIIVGQTLTFPIRATNPGSGTTVSLSASGLTTFITTANFSPAMPATGNPSSTTFTYTAGGPQLGTTTVLNFIATNNYAIQANTAITINVVAEPAPTYTGSTPGPGTIRSILAGVAQTDTITSQSVMGSNVSIAYTTAPAGVTFSPAIPTPGANPGRTVMTWTPTAADFGIHNLNYQSVISATPTISTALTYQLIADNLPVFASSPVTAVTACTPYSYNVVANDANIPYGDTVEITAETALPSWLTLTSTGNGTATLSGNPTNADAGTYIISLAAEDLFHHNYAPVLQVFTIVVSPNVITGPSDVCVGSAIPLGDAITGGTWSSSDPSSATVTGGGAVTGVATGAPVITYTLGTGCITTTTINVDPLPAPPAIAGPATVCSGSSVTLTDGMSGGVWSSSAPSTASVGSTGVVSGVAAGTATITYTVTNSFGCTNSVNAGISVSPVYAITSSAGPNGTISPVGVTSVCAGDNQTYTITPAAGYHINDVVVDGSSAGAVGSYTFATVGSVHTINATFTADCTPPVITVCPGSVTAANDPGLCNAVVTYTSAVVTGTSPVITYSQASGTVFSLGTTTVTVNAANACGSADCSFAVTVNDTQVPSVTAPAAVIVSADAGLCSASGVSLGTPTGSDNCGSVTYTNDAPATFSVGTTIVTWTADDGHGNTATATQTVTVNDMQAPSITAPAAITVPADAGLCTASGIVLGSPTGSDNCGSVTYTNDAPAVFPYGPTTVTWTADDGHGNTATATQLVTVTDLQNPTITAPAAVTVSACTPVAVAIGTPVTADNCGVATVTNDAPALFPPGVTTVHWTVTDVHGNSATATQLITVNTTALTIPATVTNVSCSGRTDGSIVTTVTGGTPAYTYLWSTGATTSSLSAMPAGIYSVTATDSRGCTGSGTYTITQPEVLTLTGTVVNVSCYGYSNGSVTTTVTGGTPSYIYSWSTGATTPNISSRPAGTYSVTVTDAHGCAATGSFTVTQPAVFAVSGVVTNVSCYGGSDGSIATTVTGGTPSYTYSWNTGATTPTLTGRTAGVYSVTVTDAGGCTAAGSYTISQPAVFSVSGSITNVSCNGRSDGSITTSITGGTPTYSYLWSTGSTTANLTARPAGTYSVTVTDGHGCTATGSYTITQPAVLAVSGTVTNVNCFGGSDGAVATTVTGGTSAYSYSWSTGATTANISGRIAGTYSVTVTDAHGCTTSGSYTVTQPPLLTCVISAAHGVRDSTPDTVVYIGYGVHSILITDLVSGGTPPYTYSWSPDTGTSSSITVHPDTTTTYTVVVTDAHGCTASCTLTIFVHDIRCCSHREDICGRVKVCDGVHTSCVDTGLVAGLLALGYTLGPCHGRAKESGMPDDDNAGASEEFKAYPNPTFGTFSVEIPSEDKQADIVVTDITGRVVEHRFVDENTGAAVGLDVSGTSPGIYYLKVSTGKNTYIAKLIKQ